MSRKRPRPNSPVCVQVSHSGVAPSTECSQINTHTHAGIKTGEELWSHAVSDPEWPLRCPECGLEGRLIPGCNWTSQRETPQETSKGQVQCSSRGLVKDTAAGQDDGGREKMMVGEKQKRNYPLSEATEGNEQQSGDERSESVRRENGGMRR